MLVEQMEEGLPPRARRDSQTPGPQVLLLSTLVKAALCGLSSFVGTGACEEEEGKDDESKNSIST